MIYVSDHGGKQWITQIKHKLCMGKGNIFVLIEIEKKTKTKALMLNLCPHNALDSQSKSLKYITHKTILLCLSHSEWFHQHKGSFLGPPSFIGEILLI